MVFFFCFVFYSFFSFLQIVHTTFLRFESKPVVDDATVRAKFEELRSIFGEGEATVECKQLVYVREARPYLHQDNSKQVMGVFDFK